MQTPRVLTIPSARRLTSPTIRLLIADDRLVVREGLKRIVAGCPDITVVGVAATAGEVLEQARASGPDVALIDLFLGGPLLRRLIRDLQRGHPPCRVLVLNVPAEDADALRILGTGAAGYVGRDYSRRQLIDAIRQVARGASYLSLSLASTLISNAGPKGRRPQHVALSDREYEVLCRFGSGTSFKEIAAGLGVSPKTVSTYRSRILAKLKLKSNAAMIRYAIEHRLVASSTGLPLRRRRSITSPSAKI